MICRCVVRMREVRCFIIARDVDIGEFYAFGFAAVTAADGDRDATKN